MKTHPYITNKFLRECFARELLGFRRGMRHADPVLKANVRFGMESGVLAVQRGMDRLGKAGADPDSVPYQQCAALVAKVVIDKDEVFTAEDIELARSLMGYEFKNPNVHDMLAVIAGIAVPRKEPLDMAYYTLTFE